MMVKILKYFVVTVIGIIILAALIATPLIIKARSEGERMYEKYDSYTREVLAQKFDLKPYPIKPEYQKMHPWKALKLFKILFQSQEGEKLARVNTLDATMGLFMKMYTLLMRPNYNFNLPMFSVDIIFIGGKRVFVIEVIFYDGAAHAHQQGCIRTRFGLDEVFSRPDQVDLFGIGNDDRSPILGSPSHAVADDWVRGRSIRSDHKHRADIIDLSNGVCHCA